MLGFQAAGAAPIYFDRVIEHPETAASAIRIGNPASWKMANAAFQESGGAIEIVTDEEIFAAQSWLASNEGVFVEPASAASVAGLFKCWTQTACDLLSAAENSGRRHGRLHAHRAWSERHRCGAERSRETDVCPSRQGRNSVDSGKSKMSLIVQKYGGTSVGTPERILEVARRILQTQRAGNQVVAVVSAMSGVTDNLIKLARQVAPHPAEREMDVLLATGEQTTIALTAMAINGLGGHAVSLTGAQAGIVTDGVHTKAKIANITPKRIHTFLDSGNIVIVAGFQGETLEGLITTLGRGGSDLTAIALAASIKADLCQIFTDVDGVYTCDPRIVKNALKIPEISYDEMLEMASLGSKVMQSRSVEFAKKFDVIFEVRSSFNDQPGTLVKEETAGMEKVVIRGVSVDRKQAKVTISGVPDKPGIASRIFNEIAAINVNVDMIVQNVSAAGSHRYFVYHPRG